MTRRRHREVHGQTVRELVEARRAREDRESGWAQLRDYLIDDADLMDAVARTIAADAQPDIQT